MKASTAAHILRAARSRFEEQGYVQLGSKELIALEFAWQHEKNKLFKEIEFMTCTAIATGKQQQEPTIPKFSEQHMQALRVAYKTLEKLPPEEEFNISAIDPTNMGKEVEELPHSTDSSDWVKELGLDENEIKKIKEQLDKGDDTAAN